MSTTASNFVTSSTVAPSTATPSTVTPGETVHVATTITSASTTCVATLRGQILNNYSTALVANSNGGYITLNETCFTHRPARVTVVTTVYQSDNPSGLATTQRNSALSHGEIAGIVLAIVSVLAVICSVVGLLCWRRRRRSRAVATIAPKCLDDDASDELALKWEKDGVEIKEMSGNSRAVESAGAEIKEMSVDREPEEKTPVDVDSWLAYAVNTTPVEIGDARSIRREASPARPAISPIQTTMPSSESRRPTGDRSPFDDLVSPL